MDTTINKHIGREMTPSPDTQRQGQAETIMESPQTGDEVTHEERIIEVEKNVEGTSDSKSTMDDKNKFPQNETMKCEIKHLDRRYDEKDQTYFAAPVETIEKPIQKDWWRLYAFCVVKHYTISAKTPSSTRLYVNQQPMRQLLKDVINCFPSDPIDVDDVQIQAPYHALFHYRHQLREEGLKRFEADEDSLAQMKLLLSWIDSTFELDIEAYEKCFNRKIKVIAYKRLWTLFRPNTVVYAEHLDQKRAYRTHDYFYDDEDLNQKFVLLTQYFDFDGENLGTVKTEHHVHKYVGIRDVHELNAMPLSLLDDAESVRETLLERGRKFEGYLGKQLANYDGIAIKKENSMGTMRYARCTVTGRVMIDCATYYRYEPENVTRIMKSRDLIATLVTSQVQESNDFAPRAKEFGRLSDEDAILTNATVRGYSLDQKVFLEFYVDKLSPIAWNSGCFEKLVIDDEIKKILMALVSTHTNKRNAFDDIIIGKGKGLVCVLHGPPGVGKTLTAECVAEYAQRPLMMVSSGELGSSSGELDRKLQRIMDLASTWDAVLLIDEADVFLEQRSLHEMHRNAMVSIFLRVLEYYGGILFLTTNRVTTFDDAIKSRMHTPIRYTELSVESRKKIWRYFCYSASEEAASGGSGSVGVDVDEAGLEALAQHDLNGRQIKNIVKIAGSLADHEGVKLSLEGLQMVTKMQTNFTKELKSLTGVDYTAPGAVRKDADMQNMYT